VRGPDGQRVEGFLVQLGGHLGEHATFGKKIGRAGVRADQLPEFIQALVGAWLEDADEGEDFSSWVQRLPGDQLELMVMDAAGAPTA
jgi:sulfite reductase (ferredoxin)